MTSFSSIHHHPVQAASAFRASQGASRAGRVHFGSAPNASPPPGNGGNAAKVGLWKTLQTLRQFFAHHHNRQVMKGLLYQYGVPALIGMSFFAPPLGWIVGLAGMLPSMMIAKRGEKILTELRASGALDNAGFLNRIVNIQNHWQDAKPGNGKLIIDEYNRLLDELLTDSDKVKNVALIRERLKLKADGRVARLLAHAFSVKVHYANKWQGKFLRGISRFAGKIPFRPIKWPIMGVALAFQALLMLSAHKLARKGVQAAARAIL